MLFRVVGVPDGCRAGECPGSVPGRWVFAAGPGAFHADRCFHILRSPWGGGGPTFLDLGQVRGSRKGPGLRRACLSCSVLCGWVSLRPR